MGALAVDSLIEALGSREYLIGWYASRILERIGEPAVPKLIQALHSQNREIRKEAIKLLTVMKRREALELYLKALCDRDSSVRVAAASYPGEIGDARAVEPLIKALKGDEPSVQEQAPHSLGKIRDERALQALTLSLSNEDPHVRYYAAVALGNLDAVETLTQLTMDTKNSIRENSLEALGEISAPKAFELLLQILQEPSSEEEGEEDSKGIYGICCRALGHNVIIMFFCGVRLTNLYSSK
jgi:HEAT repeat protein